MSRHAVRSPLCLVAGIFLVLLLAGALLEFPLASFAVIWIGIRPIDLVLGGLVWVLYVLLAAVTVHLALDLRRDAAIPLRFLDDMTDAVHQGNYRTALYLARTNQSPLAHVLAAGLIRLPHGLDTARESAFRMALTIKAEKERQLAKLEILATLGLLIGFFAGLQAW